MPCQRESRPAGNQAAPSESTAADDTDSNRLPVPTAFTAPSASAVLIRVVDGAPVFTAEAGALLFGIPAEDIAGGMTPGMVDGTESFPPEWLRAGRRRAAEARAATGDDGVIAGLIYWAKRDLGVELVIEANR